METKSYNRQSLPEFINSSQFAGLSVLPISRHRAISQVNNPRASDEDILLLVQFDEGKVIGYLGVLPDYVFFEDKPIKAGWLSCFWVDVKYRSQPLVAGLFLQMMENWDNRILITNFVPALAPLYLRTGLFHGELIKTGYRAYMRSNLAVILPPKADWLHRIKPVLRITDQMFNFFGDLRFLFFRESNISSIRWNYLNEIDEQSADFISKFQETNWNRRGRTELQWILEHPWIIERSTDDHESKRYYFSSVSKRFTYRIIKLSADSGMVSGWAMVCIRDHVMTVPYAYAEEGYYESIGRILIQIMIELKLCMITTFHDQLAQVMRKFRHPFLFGKTVLKPFLISKKLEFIHELNFEDGDGDCVFY